MDKKFSIFLSKNLLVFEILATIMFIAGLWIKYQLIWYSDILLITSCGVLGIVYFLMGRITRANKELYDFKDRFFLVIGFYGAAFVILGLAFRTQLWPYGKAISLTGTTAAVIGLIYALYAMFGQKKPFRKIVTRFLITSLIGLASLQISAVEYIEVIYSKDPEYVRLFKEYAAQPDNEFKYKEWRKYDNELRTRKN